VLPLTPLRTSTWSPACAVNDHQSWSLLGSIDPYPTCERYQPVLFGSALIESGVAVVYVLLLLPSNTWPPGGTLLATMNVCM
jgi:hypothetical protein